MLETPTKRGNKEEELLILFVLEVNICIRLFVKDAEKNLNTKIKGNFFVVQNASPLIMKNKDRKENIR